MLNDWSHKVRAILTKYCPGNIKKYCPPCHKTGIHDFILATKSSVWIIIQDIDGDEYEQDKHHFLNKFKKFQLKFEKK